MAIYQNKTLAFQRSIRCTDCDQAFLVGVLAATGFGYFWPGWVLAAWGAFLILGAWDIYYRRDLTEDDIQRELHRGR